AGLIQVQRPIQLFPEWGTRGLGLGLDSNSYLPSTKSTQEILCEVAELILVGEQWITEANGGGPQAKERDIVPRAARKRRYRFPPSSKPEVLCSALSPENPAS
ncbi:hypothetical protein HHI36_000406, partial [Cryptolaemus montrouzieri]